MESFDAFEDLVKSRSFSYKIYQQLYKPCSSEKPSSSKSTFVSMEDLVPIRKPRLSSAPRTPQSRTTPNTTQEYSNQANSKLNTISVNADDTPLTQKPNSYPKRDSPESHRFDDVENNYGNGSISASTSTSTIRQRIRDSTIDSLGTVKFTPSIMKFDDLKSEAINSWGEGVDLELSTEAKTKKKSEWLSQSAFFSESAPAQPPTQYQTFSNSSNNNTSSSNSSASNGKQTYAEATNNKTPAWATADQKEASSSYKSMDRNTPAWAADSIVPINYTPHPQGNAWPSTMVPSQTLQPMQPVMVMPSPYLPMANGYQPMGAANMHQDIEWAHCFYKIITKSDVRSVLVDFQQKVDTVLHIAPELSTRSFSLFLQALTIVMEFEANHSEIGTARKICKLWSTFVFCFNRFVQTYARMPDDLRVILKFIVTLLHFFPKVVQELPMGDIMHLFEFLKRITPPEMNAEFVKWLRLLKAIPMESTADNWGEHDFSLPSFPVADSIVFEVIDKVNALKEYEMKKEIVIANKVHNPWPNVDLLNYTLIHFIMLREELVGPIQRIIKDLFKGKGCESISVPECSIYEKTQPYMVTSSFSTSDPCVIFKLGFPRSQDDVMCSFEEGSFVVLLPEITAAVNPADRHSAMKRVAEVSMMGQAVRASCSYSSKGDLIRLVSIHIQPDDLHKLDWNRNYTIVTSNINAGSTLSVLRWLHTEYLKLEKRHWSSVLTPRILAAKNILSQSQLASWDEENHERAIATNRDAVPEYLADAEIDCSCIMARQGNFHAKPGEDVWPRHSSQWEMVSGNKRPALYCLSPSQLKAVQFALTHRIAVISGAPGTGKTYLAAKLAQLMSEALTVGLFHQPVLVITKSQSSLDDILASVVGAIPDVVRFGSEPYNDILKSKQATLLAAPNVADSNYRQFQNLERQLTTIQAQLVALLQERHKISEHCPTTLSGTMPPAYFRELGKNYNNNDNGNTESVSRNSRPIIWAAWASNDPQTKKYKPQSAQAAMAHAQWCLESIYLKRGGRGIMPMTGINTIRSRFTWIASNPAPILSIGEANKWPFESSNLTGASLRTSLLKIWSRVSPEKIWDIPNAEKTQLINSVVKALLSHIDKEIEDLLQQQIKVSQAYDGILVQKWTFLCRFKRIIGMTADFAAAHREWVSTLWPRAVIVDEATEILESTIASTIMGTRTEHVVLLGTSDNLFKPRITNPELAGNPRNLDVSLFERWKGSNSEMTLLEEQWRMHSEVAKVINEFNSSKGSKETSTLITAPMISHSDNMVDGRSAAQEVLYGITQRAFYIDFQPTSNTEIDPHYTKILYCPVTHAQVDEARYVASLAVYLSQQQYVKTGVTILTVCLIQKYLIRRILRDEIPKRTCFVKNISKIHLDTIEQYNGRQNNFAIISTATPGNSKSIYNNVTRALTRAKYGLFVIGKPEQDRVHPQWKNFASYMKDRALFGPVLQLTCHTHGDTIYAGCWQDFLMMKNGGCQRPCASLMSDGHVCKEECHFNGHDEIICEEPCNRIRPSNCTHKCENKCFECSKNGICPPCMVESSIELPCGHEHAGICHELQNSELVSCQTMVSYQFKCGHETMMECCQIKNAHKLICQVKSTTTLPCGHSVSTRCGLEPICTEICSRSLECGHKCQEMCGVPHSHDRSECVASCPKQLICGHRCAKGCKNPDDHTVRCMEKCNYICSHGYKCSRECWKDCIRCISSCPYTCKHYRCTKKCYEICDRPPCNRPCQKILNCPKKHKCSGLCGEACPPCTTCNGDLTCSITLRTLSELEEDEKIYMLPECGCVFSVEALDQFFETQVKNGNHTAIKLWECPSCQETIYTALRYNKYIKTEISLVNTIKLRMEKERQQLTAQERQEIISAMNDETRQHAIHNIVGGRWFVCPNQHPYYVGDCGGATEVSKCPECDAPIGGTQHKVVESNRFYGEFDGSEKPAWPGQPGADDNDDSLAQ